MASFELLVNGRTHRVESDPARPLLWVLRDDLQLFGTKYGCGVGVCGSCTVLQASVAVRACLVPISATTGQEYTTIEGLSADGTHACQRAWLEEDVAQCGYCQPRMILEAVALIERRPRPTSQEVDAALSTHVCRYGTYNRLRRAVQRAAELAGEER